MTGYRTIDNEMIRNRHFIHVCIRCGREWAIPYHEWVDDSWTGRTCGDVCRSWLTGTFNKRDWVKRPLKQQARRLVGSDYVLAKQIILDGGTMRDAAARLRVNMDVLTEFILKAEATDDKRSGKDAQ